MDNRFHIDVNNQQKSHEEAHICGDVFVSRRFKEENRIVAVLSDGLGHGVKANVLATLTSTMALNFTREHKDFIKTADVIMNTLPVDNERKISYATFTIVDIEADGKVSILEYDNPQTVILRGNKLMQPEWQCLILESEHNRGKELLSCSFYPRKEDRIIFCSDGVTQSGLGMGTYPFGWGRDNLVDFLIDLVSKNRTVSANDLASKVIKKSVQNDYHYSKDDTSCAVIYFREPRRLLLCTGPPFEKKNDKKLAKKVVDFEGKIILSGATTGDIIARELNREIEDSFEFTDPDLPPVSYMDGVDLMTEGILTLSKVAEILKAHHENRYEPGNGPADEIVKLLIKSDEINIVIGTRINVAHQDPSLPVELEIRRTVVKRMARRLEERYLKNVKLEFI